MEDVKANTHTHERNLNGKNETHICKVPSLWYLMNLNTDSLSNISLLPLFQKALSAKRTRFHRRCFFYNSSDDSSNHNKQLC